jgi:hypothetical protein
VYSNESRVAPEDAVFADQTPGALKDMHRESHESVTSPAVLAGGSEWIRAQVAADRPFFAFLHWWDPHYDYLAPPEYQSLFAPEYQGRFHGVHRREFQLTPGERDLTHLRALYDAEIRYTDDHLGRLFALLDELGIADDTIVVVIADHGEEFWEYGRWGHQRTLDDVVVEIPMLWRWPGHVPAGVRPTGQARIQDVFATLCELLDVRAPEYVESRTLVPLWQDPARAGYTQHLCLDVPLRDLLLEGVMDPELKILWQRSEGTGWIYDLRQPGGQKVVEKFHNLRTGEHAGSERVRQAIGELRTAQAKLPEGWQSVTIDPASMDAELLQQLEGAGYLGGDRE